MKHLKVILFASLILFSACKQKTVQCNYLVVPLPQEISSQDGESFILNRTTTITYPENNEKMLQNAKFLAEYIAETTGYELSIAEQTNRKSIVLELGLEHDNFEAYQIVVTNENIIVKGASEVGVFYGIQTLRKSIPALAKEAKIEFKPVVINDFPRFRYRGFHLDVSRHFSSKEFVKRTIDLLALHNLNRFHWHLTDDQGWRIEIKKYPKLTEIGAWRESTCIKGKSEDQDGIPHGGFYTQEDLREIIAYAAERNIVVIPEIDLPGHMLAALASYPELGCTGGPYKVWGQWGVSDDVLCVGKESTMQFIEDVLAEIVEIFPSEYIHIGGDECPKKRWKDCPVCQAKVKELGIKTDKNHSAEEYLQSYVIQRVEKFLNEKGRRIIGWDEILEGGLAPNAAVMSWRGMNGGTEAALQGHEVIMTPNTHLYFDYYQTRDTENEQFAIGGFIDVERAYSLEPVPSILAPEKHHLIAGAQANLWNEYLPTEESREYMMLPRMAALCEVCWTLPEKKNYEDFISRMPKMIDIYERDGLNYAKHLLEVGVQIAPNIEKGATEITLSTLGDAPIYYTLDGSEPNENSILYSAPFDIKETCVLKTAAIRNSIATKVKSQEFSFNKSSLKPINFTLPVHNNYAYISAEILVDGIVGDPIFNSGKWIGYLGTDFQAEIDLKEVQEISSVKMDLLVEPGNYIFGAAGIKVEVSDDGKTYRTIVDETYNDYDKWEHVGKTVEQASVEFTPVQTRYIRVTGVSVKNMPKWHGATGEPAWIFVGEIETF
ncbi:MAG: family 20 glycosylhydrolase [Paludibacteraceae bacterium]|nr:family 20 glycosylhydrolase [Paludibacteraceae bacterium]